MFDPGFWEMVVIAVLALLILGPERLPVVARKVGFWVGRARRYIASVRSDIEREFRTDELERMLSEQSSEIKELRNMLTSQKDQVVGAVKETEYLLKARPETPDAADKPDATPQSKPAPDKTPRED
ncbi:MAG TPA: twin-arginine translocase subunit TatB [Gammaproteobacteria bacterium]|nr:twin-arginine translocase subunit TatB [Gammaproteobacteria bacterium]